MTKKMTMLALLADLGHSAKLVWVMVLQPTC